MPVVLATPVQVGLDCRVGEDRGSVVQERGIRTTSCPVEEIEFEGFIFKVRGE